MKKQLVENENITTEMIYQSLANLKAMGLIEYSITPGTTDDNTMITVKLHDDLIARPETVH